MSNHEPFSPQILASMELFRGLPPAALEEVMAAARIRAVAKDTRLFNHGDSAERAHALIEGSIRISQSDYDGAEVVVRFIAPGETFGTVGLFTDQRYPADATTLADSIVISWSRMELFALIDRHPHIAVNVIQVIGKRLKEAQDRMRELSTQRVARRVAHAVLRLARQAGHNTGDGTVIEFPLTRSDVANMSGTTLHTASRVLAAWEKSGLLASDKQQVTLRRVTELQRIADDL